MVCWCVVPAFFFIYILTLKPYYARFPVIPILTFYAKYVSQKSNPKEPEGSGSVPGPDDEDGSGTTNYVDDHETEGL